MSHEFLGKYLVRLGIEHGYGQPMLCHWCPACNELHGFACEEPQRNGARWKFDGNLEFPSFTPSMNITIGKHSRDKYVCHYFLTSGIITYQSDSTHKLSGKTTRLPELPESVLLRYR